MVRGNYGVVASMQRVENDEVASLLVGLEIFLEEWGNYGVALMDDLVVALMQRVENDEMASLLVGLVIHVAVLLLVGMENYEVAYLLEGLDDYVGVV